MEAKVTKLKCCELDQGSFKNSPPQNAIFRALLTINTFEVYNGESTRCFPSINQMMTLFLNGPSNFTRENDIFIVSKFLVIALFSPLTNGSIQ